MPHRSGTGGPGGSGANHNGEGEEDGRAEVVECRTRSPRLGHANKPMYVDAVLALLDALDAAERERDAYRKAKQENDERFQIERDAARAEAEKWREAAVRANDSLAMEQVVSGLAGAGMEQQLTGARAEADRLRAALVAIRDHDPQTCDGIAPRDCLDTVGEIARTALEGE